MRVPVRTGARRRLHDLDRPHVPESSSGDRDLEPAGTVAHELRVLRNFVRRVRQRGGPVHRAGMDPRIRYRAALKEELDAQSVTGAKRARIAARDELERMAGDSTE